MSEPLTHLVQLNIAKTKAPVDSPLLADFKAMLDPINELADSSPGFVWRLKDDEGNDATSVPFPGADETVIVNMSIWETVEQLWSFVYASEHLAVMRRRREWFEGIDDFMCLWWIPSGTRPTLTDARERLDHLEEHGPTPHAFTFKRRFNSAGTPLATTPTPLPLGGEQD
ncbi:DUF3291 domain-containing protein [soil metagenome]